MGLAQHTSRLGVGERTPRDKARQKSREEAVAIWAAMDRAIEDALSSSATIPLIDLEADDVPSQP